jgi:hypothetical protein
MTTGMGLSMNCKGDSFSLHLSGFFSQSPSQELATSFLMPPTLSQPPFSPQNKKLMILKSIVSPILKKERNLSPSLALLSPSTTNLSFLLYSQISFKSYLFTLPLFLLLSLNFSTYSNLQRLSLALLIPMSPHTEGMWV